MLRTRNRGRGGFSGGDVPFIPAKLTVQASGQSLMAYWTTRGTPRVADKFCEWLRDEMGYIAGAGFTSYTGGNTYVSNDAGSKNGTNYTVRLCNSASGGANLIDLSSPDNVLIGNYFWNTKNNSALSPDGALDAVPNSAGPLWRIARQAILDYGVDLYLWSQGQTDCGFADSNDTNAGIYESAMRGFIADMRTVSGKPNMPFVFLHMCRNNTYTDSNVQRIVDIQTKIALDTPYVYIGAEEYFSAWGVISEIAACTTVSGSPTIMTANTAGISVNRGIEGAGIPDNSYVNSVVDNVSITLNKNATASAIVTLLLMEGTHPYPSSLAGYDTDTTKGNFNVAKRSIKPLKKILAKTAQKSFGAYPSGISATFGNNYIDLTITHDGGTDLTTPNGAISSACNNLFRVENNGTPMVLTSVAKLNGNTIRLNTAAAIGAGSLKVWSVHGSLNKSNYLDFIVDNAPEPMPLQRRDPTNYPYLSTTIPAPPRQPMDTYGISNVVAQWDATLLGGYSGSGNSLPNLITTPADGSAKSAYDMTLNGLTFVGTVGDPAAKFTSAGAGYTELTSGVNTSFIASLHKTTGGSDYTVAMVFEAGSTAAACLFSTHTTTSQNGIEISPAANITHRQGNGTTNSSALGGVIAANTRYLLIISHNAVAGTSARWINTKTGTVQTHTFGTTVTDANAILRLFCRTNSVALMSSGSVFVAASVLNISSDDATASQLVDYYNNTHVYPYA